MTSNDEFDKTTTPKQTKTIKEQTISNIERSSEQQLVELDKAQKSLINIYKNEQKVPVRVAPSYAKYFGRVMRVSINGISVAVKCDGNTVNLPESFATEVMRRMNEMDNYELRTHRMSDIRRNVESAPGEIKFF